MEKVWLNGEEVETKNIGIWLVNAKQKLHSDIAFQKLIRDISHSTGITQKQLKNAMKPFLKNN